MSRVLTSIGEFFALWRFTRVAFFVVVLLVAIGVWKLFFSENGDAENYLTATVERGEIQNLVTATGVLQPREYVDVGAQVSGQLRKLLVVVGQQVKAGDLLAEIDATVFRAKVGVIIDYEYGDIFEEERHRFTEVRVPSQAQLIKMLQQGRIDAALMFEEEANQTLKEMGLSNTAIQKGMFNHTSDIYLAFSRKKPYSQELARKFDQGIKTLKETGEYEQLLNP